MTGSAPFRRRCLPFVRGGMEAVLLGMIALSPWAFGSVDAFFERYLSYGHGLILALWALHIFLDGKARLPRCGVTVCLAGLLAIGLLQIVPLPPTALEWLSPQAASLHNELRPTTSEVLPTDQADATASARSTRTLSLYPTATREALIRLLAVFLIFLAVRSTLSSSAAFYRVCWVSFLNGVALSLFAIVQFLSSPPNQIYWQVTAPGTGFGPFICRNHFPFYVNICLGLGVGLLLSLRRRRAYRSRADSLHGHCSGKQQHPAIGLSRLAEGHDRFGLGGLLDRVRLAVLAVLDQPLLLAVCLGLGLMAAASLLSLSRGGMAALLCGTTAVVLLSLYLQRRITRAALLLLPAATAVGLVLWLGIDALEARLATVWEGTALESSRMPLWTRSLTAALQFPVFGSGFGTFSYIEPLTRTASLNVGTAFEHAHNDYLEALVEGGLIRFAVSLTAIAFIGRRGWLALNQRRKHWSAGLVLGGITAFTTIVIHSIGEFGLHIPAIAVLSVVVVAHLTSLSDRTQSLQRRESADKTKHSRPSGLEVRGIGCFVLALTLLALAGFLALHASRMNRVQRLRLLGQQVSRAPASANDAAGFAHFDRAIALAPDFARLHAEKAEMHLDRFESCLSLSAHALAGETVVRVAPTLASPMIGPLEGPANISKPSLMEAVLEHRFRRNHLYPGLAGYVRARDLNPLLPAPHLRLAIYADAFVKADPRNAYLDRATRLRRYDPEVWYVAGLHEALDGRWQEAWKKWRYSLDISDDYLVRILRLSRPRLNDEEMLSALLPNRADRIYAAARLLYPQQSAAPQRERFYDHALNLLKEQPEKLGEDWHLQAVVHETLGQPLEALAAYEQALAREPNKPVWRFEYARLLFSQKRWQQARFELATVLDQQPTHKPARELMTEITRVLVPPP